MLHADAVGAADLAEDLQETGVSTWATVQAALLSAIPFGLASICMLVSLCTHCKTATTDFLIPAWKKLNHHWRSCSQKGEEGGQ